jgi:hypothetical protein
MSKHLIKADPKRPYKLYAAMASAFITSMIGAGLDLPGWATALGTAAVAAIAVFLTPNPIVGTVETAPVAPDVDANGDRYLY